MKSEPSRPAAEKPIEAKPAEVETPAAKPEPAKVEAPVAKAAPAKEKPDGKEQIAALRRGLASTRGGFIARAARPRPG